VFPGRPSAPAPVGATPRASGDGPRSRCRRARTRPSRRPCPRTDPHAVPAPFAWRRAVAHRPARLPRAAVTTIPVPAPAAPPRRRRPCSRGDGGGERPRSHAPGARDADCDRAIRSRPRAPALRHGLAHALVDETGAVVRRFRRPGSPRGLDFEDAATKYVRTRAYKPANQAGRAGARLVADRVEFRLPVAEGERPHGCFARESKG